MRSDGVLDGIAPCMVSSLAPAVDLCVLRRALPRKQSSRDLLIVGVSRPRDVPFSSPWHRLHQTDL